jgi:hypothetical protein
MNNSLKVAVRLHDICKPGIVEMRTDKTAYIRSKIVDNYDSDVANLSLRNEDRRRS